MFIGNKCYQIFTGLKTWQESVDACRQMGDGYDLASISSTTEQGNYLSLLVIKLLIISLLLICDWAS